MRKNLITCIVAFTLIGIVKGTDYRYPSALVKNKTHPLISDDGTDIRLASVTSAIEMTVKSQNSTSLCCLVSTNVSPATGTQNIFNNVEPVGGKGTTVCTHNSVSPTLLDGISVKSYTATSSTGVYTFGADLMPASSTWATRCRVIWSYQSTSEQSPINLHSTEFTDYKFQTAGSLSLLESDEEDISAIEINANGNDNIDSVIFVNVMLPEDTTPHAKTSSFKFKMGSTNSYANKFFNKSQPYTCPSVHNGEITNTDKADCDCDEHEQLDLTNKVELDTMLNTAHKVAVRPCVKVNDAPGTPCYAGSCKIFSGKLTKHEVAVPANEYSNPSPAPRQFPWQYPSAIVDKVTGGQYAENSLQKNTIYMHTNGLKYSIPLEGRTFYKPTAVANTIINNDLLEICTTWWKTSCDICDVEDEVCKSIQSSEAITVESSLAYGKAIFRWRLSDQSISKRYVYSAYTDQIHFGWFPGMPNVKMNIAHYGDSFDLNPTDLPSTESMLMHMKLLETDSIIHTDSFTITAPSGNYPNGTYACYDTVEFARETLTSQLKNLCTANVTAGTVGCNGNAQLITADEMASGYTRTALNYMRVASQGKLLTVVVQYCNPSTLIRGLTGYSSNGPTGPTNGIFNNKCSFAGSTIAYPTKHGGPITATPCLKIADKQNPHIRLSTVADEEAYIQDKGSEFLRPGDGLIEAFPFNAVPLPPTVTITQNNDDSTAMALSATPRSYGESPKIVIRRTGSTSVEKSLTRAICYTVSPAVDGDTAPPVICKSTVAGTTCENFDTAPDNTITINIMQPLNHYRISSCNGLIPNNQQGDTNSDGFLVSPSVTEVSGYAGNENVPVIPHSYFSINHNIMGSHATQTCYKSDMSTNFSTFQIENTASDNAQVTKTQTVHNLRVDAWLPASTPDTTGASLGNQLYGWNVAPADQEEQIMRASNCDCKHIKNPKVAHNYTNVTMAIGYALQMLNTKTSGLFAIRRYDEDSVPIIEVEECKYNIDDSDGWTASPVASATGVHKGVLGTKYSTTSMCLRKYKLEDDKPQPTQNIMSTRVSAALSSSRMVDNFSPATQLKDGPGAGLTCVNLAYQTIKKTTIHGAHPYPLSMFQINSALSAETKRVGQVGSKIIPPVLVLQATAGSLICADISKSEWKTGKDGATSTRGGYRCTGPDCKHQGTMCHGKDTVNTFESIIEPNTLGMYTTVGDMVKAKLNELYTNNTVGLHSKPEWRYGSGSAEEDVLTDCEDPTVSLGNYYDTQNVEYVRFVCKTFIVGSRENNNPTVFRQPIGSCVERVNNNNNGMGLYRKTGPATAARMNILKHNSRNDTEICPSGGVFGVIVTKWRVTEYPPDQVPAQYTHYMIEADQYDYNDETTTDLVRSFVNDDSQSVGPSTRLHFYAGNDRTIRLHKAKGVNRIGMVVTTCATNDPSSSLSGSDSIGELMPSYLRTDLLHGGQPIGDTTNSIEMRNVCSDDFSASCNLGPHGEPRPDGDNCGYHDASNTQPRRCGARKIEMELVATNNLFFTQQLMDSDAIDKSLQMYGGYLGSVSTSGFITSWMQLNLNSKTMQRMIHDPDTGLVIDDPDKPASHSSLTNWAVYSWSGATSDDSGPLPSGLRIRELNVATSVISLINEANLNFDAQSMPQIISFGDQSLLGITCPIPSPRVVKIISSITSDLTRTNQVAFTSSKRDVVRSAQWLSFQYTRRFKQATFDALDSSGNTVSFRSGRQPKSPGTVSALIAKIRLRTVMTTSGAPVSISHARNVKLIATLASSEFQTGNKKHTCQFGAISDLSRGTDSNRLSSMVDDTCMPTSNEALHLSGGQYADPTAPSYFAPKCGTIASSVRNYQDPTAGCSVISEQGFDMALLNNDHNANECPYFEELKFEKAEISGLDLMIYNDDADNTPTHCQEDNTHIWYLQQDKNQTKYDDMKMCSVSAQQPNATCFGVTSQYMEFKLPMGSADSKMSYAVNEDADVVTQTLSKITVSAKADVSIIHPAIKLNEGISGPITKQLIESIPLIYTMANRYTKVQIGRDAQDEYFALGPSCNSDQDAENTQLVQPSFCKCNAAIPAGHQHSKDDKKGYARFDLNKGGCNMAVKEGKFGNAMLNGIAKTDMLTSSICAVPTLDDQKSLNPYSSFIVFSSELYASERSQDPTHVPRIETALVYACLLPRTSQRGVIEGIRTTETYDNMTGAVSTHRRQLCPKDETLVYLHWGSKRSFDYILLPTTTYFAVPTCSGERRIKSTDDPTSHGQSPDATEVFDLSESIISGVRTVSDNCNVSASYNYKATNCDVINTHVTYSKHSAYCNTSCNIPLVPTKDAKHPHELYSPDFQNELEKVKANVFDMKLQCGSSKCKYGIFINEVFGDKHQSTHASTLTLDSKLFGAYAKAVEINEIVVVSESNRVEKHSRRTLLQSSTTLTSSLSVSGSSGNIAQSSSTVVPECPKAAGSISELKYTNGTSLICGSQTCDNKDLTVSATDNTGFSFQMNCEHTDDEDDNRTAIIWIVFGMSLLALIMVCAVCIYFGYHTMVIQKIQETKDTMIEQSRQLHHIL